MKTERKRGLSPIAINAMEQEITDALATFKNFDVVNNSWGASANFDLNVIPVGPLEQGILDAVTQGRGGKTSGRCSRCHSTRRHYDDTCRGPRPHRARQPARRGSDRKEAETPGHAWQSGAAQACRGSDGVKNLL